MKDKQFIHFIDKKLSNNERKELLKIIGKILFKAQIFTLINTKKYILREYDVISYDDYIDQFISDERNYSEILITVGISFYLMPKFLVKDTLNMKKIVKKIYFQNESIEWSVIEIMKTYIATISHSINSEFNNKNVNSLAKLKDYKMNTLASKLQFIILLSYLKNSCNKKKLITKLLKKYSLI